MSQTAPLLTMLTAYLFLTVLMNVVFVLYDDGTAESSILDFSIAEFPIRTVGYWALLFLPFVLVPPIAMMTRWLAANRVATLAGLIPEFRWLDYLLVTGICYAVVITAMYRADAWPLFLQGTDAFSSVEARFELLARLHFFERAILQSALMFLTLYSLVRAVVGRNLLWLIVFAANIVAMAVLLLLLNMKWPIVVLFGGVVAVTALFSKRRWTNSAIGIVAMICVYMLVGTVILRIPQPAPVTPAPTSQESEAPSRDQPEAPVSLEGAVTAAKSSGPRLAISGLVRMALPYPFYYRTFTSEGQICGTLLDRIELRPSPCHPSVLIYDRMFVNDQFASRGTAPAPFHVTGYALNGWIGAIIESVSTAIVIGLFMAVPADRSPIAGTIVVMGILTGYFFSQLPFEGPIIYDHGLLWWALLILVYSLIRRMAFALRARTQVA